MTPALARSVIERKTPERRQQLVTHHSWRPLQKVSACCRIRYFDLHTAGPPPLQERHCKAALWCCAQTRTMTTKHWWALPSPETSELTSWSALSRRSPSDARYAQHRALYNCATAELRAFSLSSHAGAPSACHVHRHCCSRVPRSRRSPRLLHQLLC